MNQFDNVTVIKKANLYFDGKVTSRTVLFSDGSKKTLGIIMPGTYEFGTADKEIMEILSGSGRYLISVSQEWSQFREGDRFEVPANSSFQIETVEITDYCCSYGN